MKATLTASEFAALQSTAQSEYTLDGDKYILKLEGDHPLVIKARADAEEHKGEVVKFRDNNISILKENGELKKKLETFKDVDPAEYAKAKERIAELEKKGVKAGDDVTAVIAKQVEAALKPLQDTVATLTKSKADAETKLAEKELESVLRDAGTKAGVDEKAMSDYIRRGKDQFKLEEGKVVAKAADGSAVFSTAKPGQPLGVEEWAGNLLTDAPHLFKSSTGGGTKGGAGAPPAKKVISIDDPFEFGKNLEKIAKGDVVVQ